jgi:hypothetical protein
MENTNKQNHILKIKSFEWIVNAIESSNNPFHVDGCKKLIELYALKFQDEQKEMELALMLSNKENHIYYI